MNQKNNLDINFAALFDNILRRFWLVVLCAVIAAGAAYGYVRFFVDPVYSSTATLYIGNDTGEFGYTEANLYKTLAKDFEYIIKKPTVTEEVVNRLGLNMSASQLRDCMSVSNIAETRILEIVVSTSDPDLSKSIADTICSVASERFVSILNVNYVSTVDMGSLAKAPSNINYLRSMVLAAMAGALVCVFVIIVRTLMDDKIKSPDDVEYYLGLSVLGTTPFSKNLEGDNSSSHSSIKRKLSKNRRHQRSGASK